MQNIHGESEVDLDGTFNNGPMAIVLVISKKRAGIHKAPGFDLTSQLKHIFALDSAKQGSWYFIRLVDRICQVPLVKKHKPGTIDKMVSSESARLEIQCLPPMR